MIEIIIFDMDDVLYHFDQEARHQEFANLANIDVEEFRTLWLRSGWEHDAERGKFKSGDEYLKEFNILLGTSISKPDWIKMRKKYLRPNFITLECAQQLKANGHEIAILTNNGALLGDSFAQVAPEAFAIFGSNCHCSYEFGARKPEAKVFQNILTKFAKSPEQAIFIDDRIENIKGAQSIGINAYQYDLTIDIEAIFKSYNLL